MICIVVFVLWYIYRIYSLGLVLNIILLIDFDNNILLYCVYWKVRVIMDEIDFYFKFMLFDN